MRVRRYSSSSRPRLGRGCGGILSLFMTLGVLFGVVMLSRDWWRDWFLQGDLAPENITLNDAHWAYERGDLDKTIEYSRQLMARDTTDIAALEILVRALVYRSYTDYDHNLDRQRALEHTTESVGQFPYDMDVLAIHAFAQHANGKSDIANNNALRVINRNPESITARVALALSYGQTGLFEAALRESQQAVQLATEQYPNWLADAYRAQAIAYSDLARYNDALQSVERAIQQHRRLAPLHFEGALYALQQSDSDSATAYYFNVIAFDDGNVKARLRLCEVSSLLRETDEALEYCSDVTSRAPGWDDGWYRLGREYFLQGDFQAAQEALGKCSTLQVAQDVPIPERQFECWYLQGQAAELLGDCATLLPLYAEYQEMARAGNLSQTWIYPPEGPLVCVDFIPAPQSG